MSGMGSVSLNMVWNPAIKGSSFLQASVKGIHTYAQKVTKANLLQSTKFPLLNRNLKSLTGHLGKIRSTTAKISANPIKLDIKTSRNSLSEARKDMTAIQHDAKQTAFFTKKSAENLRSGARAQRVANTRRKSISGGSMVGAASAVGIMALPFKASIDFESTMADVKALTKNITNDDFLLLSAQARFLGASTEWSATQAATGMTYLAKAGFDTKQQLGAMSGVLGLATAGNVELGVSSDIASNILSGFGIEAHKMGKVSDILAKTFTTSNTDLMMLGETMKYTAPIAAGLGVGLTEVSALAGKLGDVGIQGSMAGTSLRQMYTRLSAPPKEAQNALDSLGISIFNAEGKFKGMPSIIGELNSSMSNLSDKDKTTKLKHIFGMTALSSGIALMKVGKKGLLDYKKTLENSTGTTAGIQKIKLATTAGEFKLLGSALESLSITGTTRLLPAVNFITRGIRSLSGILESFSTKFPQLSSWVFGLGAAFVVGSVGLAAFGFVASGVGAAIGFISLPVLAVIAGITALTVAGVYLYNNFESVRVGISGVFLGIREAISPTLTEFKTAFSSIFESFGMIYTEISPLFELLGKLFKKLTGISGASKGIGTVIGKAFSFALSPAKLLISAISKIIRLSAKAYKIVGGVFGADKKEDEKKENSKPWYKFWGSDKKEKSLLLNNFKSPANNATFKTLNKNSISLTEIPAKKVSLESVSALSDSAILQKQMQIQNNNNNKTASQVINNKIIVNAVDGEIDEEDLYIKMARVQKRIDADNEDINIADAS